MSEMDPKEVSEGATGDKETERRRRSEGYDPLGRTKTPDERRAEKLARSLAPGGGAATDRARVGAASVKTPDERWRQKLAGPTKVGRGAAKEAGTAPAEEEAARDRTAEDMWRAKVARGSPKPERKTPRATGSPKTPEDRRRESKLQRSTRGTATQTKMAEERWDKKVQAAKEVGTAPAEVAARDRTAEDMWRAKVARGTPKGKPERATLRATGSPKTPEDRRRESKLQRSTRGTATQTKTAEERWDEKVQGSADRRRPNKSAEERWREKVERGTAGGTVAPKRTADERWAEKVSDGMSEAQGEASRSRGQVDEDQDNAAPGPTDDSPMEREKSSELGRSDVRWRNKMRLSVAAQTAAAIPRSEPDSPSAPKSKAKGRRRSTPSDRWRDKVRQSLGEKSQGEKSQGTIDSAVDSAVVTIHDCVSVETEYVSPQDQDEGTATVTPSEGELSARRNDEALPPSGTPPNILLRDLEDEHEPYPELDPEPEPDVFRAELAPDDDLRPVVDVLDVAVLPEDVDDKPKIARRDKIRLGCIAGLASVGLGVGLGVGLTRKGSGPVCKYVSPWKKVSTISHPTVKSKVQLKVEGPSIVTDISRAFGRDVSLSDDGDRLAVSSRFGDGVSVYEYTGGNWVQLGQDITSEEDIVFTKEDDFYEASSAAVLSGDGNRVAVSFPYHSDNEFSRRGVVRVYEYRTGSWMLVGNGLKGTRRNEYLGDKFGVDLSTDGSIVAIGDYRHVNNTGRVRVFQDKSGNWTQLGHEMNGEARGDWFGYSLSLSGNGTTVAIGASKHDGENGYARVFRLSEDVWTPGEDIYGGVGDCNFGWFVSLPANASRIAVSSASFVGDEMTCLEWGDLESRSYNGAVRMFEYSMGNWTEMGPGFVGGQENDAFGSATSLSGDGSTLVVGASTGAINGFDSGYARAYRHECGSWAQVGADLLGAGSADWFGESVSLSYNGERMAVGAPTDFLVPMEKSGTATIYSHTFG